MGRVPRIVVTNAISATDGSDPLSPKRGVSLRTGELIACYNCLKTYEIEAYEYPGHWIYGDGMRRYCNGPIAIIPPTAS